MNIKTHPEIKSLEFEVSSSKSVIAVDSLDESIEAACDALPPEEKYCTEIKIRVFAVNSSGERAAEAAFLSGTSFEAEAAIEEEAGSFFELCDMVSADLARIAEAITDENGVVKQGICPPERNILYIHHMYVEEAYRGAGIGRCLLDNLNELLIWALNYSHHVCILNPFPQEKSGDHCLQDKEGASPGEVERLIAFYKRAGYKIVRGSKCMYKIQPDVCARLQDE